MFSFRETQGYISRNGRERPGIPETGRERPGIPETGRGCPRNMEPVEISYFRFNSN